MTAETAETAGRSPSEALIERHRDLWADATTRAAFVRGVRDGTLPVDAFGRWLAQDRLFVKGLFGAQARVMALTGGEVRRLLLGGLVALQDELDWFGALALAHGASLEAEPVESCDAYVDYLCRLAFEPPAVALTAIWAVERAYLDAWAAARPSAPRYREFIDHWTNEEFGEYVDGLQRAADAALDAASDEERAAAERAFVRVARFERRFWEMTDAGEPRPSTTGRGDGDA